MHVQDSSITTETFRHVQDSSKLLCMSRIVVHDGRCRELPAGCLELNQLQQSLAHLIKRILKKRYYYWHGKMLEVEGGVRRIRLLTAGPVAVCKNL